MCFKFFDRNDDDFITVEEMQTAFASQGTDLTPGELNDLFQEVDQDLDGLISYEGRGSYPYYNGGMYFIGAEFISFIRAESISWGQNLFYRGVIYFMGVECTLWGQNLFHGG